MAFNYDEKAHIADIEAHLQQAKNRKGLPHWLRFIVWAVFAFICWQLWLADVGNLTLDLLGFIAVILLQVTR